MIITGRGLACVGAATVIAVVSGSLALFWWLTAAIAMLLAIDIARAARPEQLQWSHETGPPLWRKGGEYEVSLNIAPPGKRSVHVRVRDAWQPSVGIAPADCRHHARLAAGQSSRFTHVARPWRTGRLCHDHLGVWVYGPLGLAGRSGTLFAKKPTSVLVAPAFRTQRHAPGLIKRMQYLEGGIASSLRAAGTEFDSLRTYVRGDDVRSIDWRATARARETMVQTFRPEQDRRILVVIDASRGSAIRVGDEPAFDAAIEATLLITTLAESGGDHVDVWVMTTHLKPLVVGGRGGGGSQLMTALANISCELVEPDWASVGATLAHESRHHSLVVLLTAIDPGVNSQVAQVAGHLASSTNVCVGSAIDPVFDELARPWAAGAECDDVMIAAAAAQAVLARHDAVGALRARGVVGITRDADTLGVGVCDHYLELKARGRL